MGCYSTINRKEVLIHATKQMNLLTLWHMKETPTKGHLLHDSTSMKYPE